MERNPLPQEPLLLDEQTFEKIQRQYAGRLIQSIVGMVGDRDKAEDIAARSFNTAWEKRESFRGEALPSSWIHQIARNAALESQRRERAIQLESMDRTDVAEIPAAELVADELEKREDRLRLQNAMSRLSSKHRRTLIAHFIDGLSIREVAFRERVPMGTVLSRIHKAKQLLREAWDAPHVSRAELAAHTPPPQPEEKQRSQARGLSKDHQHQESPEPVTWSR
jgi:RNA polymerase sigma-70 factor (ECF subfamily)